jgi:HlyD family secretion protein
MKRFIKWSLILGILGLIGGTGISSLVSYMKESRRVTFREAEVTRGRIVAVVNSTGTIKPVRSVSVGSFVSGPIKSIPSDVDFNREVKEGQLLAKIDPLIYDAAVARDRAILKTRKADINRVKALLQQAKNDEKRAEDLRAKSKDKVYISDSEMDQLRFARESLDAQLAFAEASVLEAQGNLDSSIANLGYTDIRSPVDGIIIDRKIDPGQTVASTFQTPELFIVAPDLRTEIYVFANVDETDIGLVRTAQQTHQPVLFTVDAWPDDLFKGKIFQIRMSSTTTQNVVTYPVVVSAPNPDLKLLPGMTANLSFQLRASDNLLRLPDAALRFFPQRDHVHPEDRPKLEARNTSTGDTTEVVRTAEEKAKIRAKRNTRYVWVVDGDYLRAVQVVIGLSDNSFTEIVSGDLKEGQKIVTGVQPRD